jgi:hypothetical protein
VALGSAAEAQLGEPSHLAVVGDCTHVRHVHVALLGPVHHLGTELLQYQRLKYALVVLRARQGWAREQAGKKLGRRACHPHARCPS